MPEAKSVIPQSNGGLRGFVDQSAELSWVANSSTDGSFLLGCDWVTAVLPGTVEEAAGAEEGTSRSSFAALADSDDED